MCVAEGWAVIVNDDDALVNLLITQHRFVTRWMTVKKS